MPYVEKERRDRLDLNLPPRTPGELNYVLTTVCLEYVDGEPNYTFYNEVIGVLECVKQEFYRRAVAPYEDTKIAENGDVYP